MTAHRWSEGQPIRIDGQDWTISSILRPPAGAHTGIVRAVRGIESRYAWIERLEGQTLIGLAIDADELAAIRVDASVAAR